MNKKQYKQNKERGGKAREEALKRRKKNIASIEETQKSINDRIDILMERLCSLEEAVNPEYIQKEESK